jgi:diadenosine tetraphosphatase ApaH/serine/threonine PP2A family protein phosphatase
MGTNVEGIQYVHASPRSPTREYITLKDARNKRRMREIFEALEWVCFVGHTHVPGVFTEDDFSKPADLLGHIYLLDPDEKALINVGSVGQPRDGDPRACYVTFDGEGVRFCRVQYDVDRTVSKIAGIQELDNFLGERLREGK